MLFLRLSAFRIGSSSGYTCEARKGVRGRVLMLSSRGLLVGGLTLCNHLHSSSTHYCPSSRLKPADRKALAVVQCFDSRAGMRHCRFGTAH